jgi:hypothetical protein
MENNKCENIKSKLRNDLDLLKTGLFELPLNISNIQDISASIENKLIMAIYQNCFGDDTNVEFRLLINNLNSLSKFLSEDKKIVDLSWFRISIKYLLLKMEIK